MKKVIIISFIFVAVLGSYAQEKNIKYMFQTETGIAFSFRSYTIHQTFVNGITISNKHSIGLGLGIGEVLAEWDTYLSMPVFINYRYNFLTPDRSPFINIAAGVSLRKESAQLYSSLTAGLQFYIFSISSGILLQTTPTYSRTNSLLPACIIQVGIRL